MSVAGVEEENTANNFLKDFFYISFKIINFQNEASSRKQETLDYFIFFSSCRSMLLLYFL